MYQKFKNQFMLELAKTYSMDLISDIEKKLDIVAYDFDIKEKETKIAVYSNEVPIEVKEYLLCMKLLNYSDGSIYNKGTMLAKFFSWVKKPVQKVTKNDVRIYLLKYNEIYGKNVQNVTLEKYREILASFFKWCLCEGYVEHNCVENIPPIKYEKKIRHSLTREEWEYIRRNCNSNREKAIVETLYSTGARIGEVTNIKLNDINWTTGEVIIFGEKSKKYRKTYLNASAKISIKEYIKKERKGDSEYVFVSKRGDHDKLSTAAMRKILKDISKRSGEVHKNVTPHVIRHTFATNARNSGMSIENIKTLLGHKNYDTTLEYIDFNPTDVQYQHEKYVV